MLFGYISASPFVMQEIHDLSTGWFTLAFALNAAGLTAANIVNAKLLGRTTLHKLLRAGLVLLVVWSALFGLNALLGPALWITVVLLFLAVSSLGLVIANAATIALEQVRHAAGTGSAILGALQFLLAAIVAPLVGIAGEDTAVPMALAMFLSAVLGLASLAVARTRG
ncbi:hypothetical protein Q8814_07755 [Rhodococcus sp. CC-R104]|uniref:Uncharacterized protein n=1 Tax=Rhodococcus chondri TaxID=3065941 RepID=A0ABU7JQ33_9NOCA|nr:hypothetical protein [Rhodococcus sp. CC-R104]